MGDVDLRFPFGGLSDDRAHADQEPLTTSSAKNVRSVPGVSGRLQGGQRPGLTRFLDAQINAGSKIAAMASVTYDLNRLSYAQAAAGSETTRWSTMGTANEAVPAIVHDDQSNVYFIDGKSGVTKLNSAGTRLYTINLPTTDDAHRCRALLVDELRFVFAAVSEGGDQDEAAIFCYRQLPDDETELLWTITPGCYVERMRIHGADDELYTVQNDVENQRAYLRVYGGLNSTAPGLRWERQIPYPVNDLALSPEGFTYTAHPADVNRGTAFAADGFSLASEDWTPEELVSFDERVWCWLRADDLAATLSDGDDVTFWPDRTGQGRNLYIGSIGVSTPTPPTFRSRGIGPQPSVSFDGGAPAASGGPYPSPFLESGVNITLDAGSAYSQRTILPAYTGSMFCMFIVIRGIPHASAGHQVFWQNRSGGTNFTGSDGNNSHAIGLDCSEAAPWGFEAGTVTAYQALVAASSIGPNADGASNQRPRDSADAPGGAYDYRNGVNTIVLTYLCDGGVDPSTATTSDKDGVTRSLIRVNGRVVDRFTSLSNTTFARTLVGCPNISTGLRAFQGDISEILVLRDSEVTPWGAAGLNIGTGKHVLTHPFAGDEAPTSGFAGDTSGESEMERVEGYLAHRHGCAHLLPTTHPYHISKGAPTGTGADTSGLYSSDALLCKWGPTRGDFQWVLTGGDANDETGTDGVGGIGYGVELASTGDIYSVGLKHANDSTHVRRIADLGATYSLRQADGAWADAFDGAQDPTYAYPRLAVDKFDNLFVPHSTLSSTHIVVAYDFAGDMGAGQEILSINADSRQRGRAVSVDPKVPDYSKQTAASPDIAEHIAVGTSVTGTQATGQILFSTLAADGSTITIDDGVNPPIVYEFDTSNDGVSGSNVQIAGTTFLSQMTNFFTGIQAQHALGAKVNLTAENIADPAISITGGNFYLIHDQEGTVGNEDITQTGTTNAIVSGMSGGSSKGRQPSIFRFGLLTVSDVVQAVRQVSTLAVSGGSVFKFTSSSAAVVTGGTAALNSASRYTHAVTAFGEVFFADGRGYFVYNPRTNTLRPFEEEDGGEFKKRCKILEVWRARLVGIRDPDDPGNWHMSEQGKPFRWNQFPASDQTALAQQAISGNNALAGTVPDIVNAFVPYNDDLAIFGGDASIWRMTGDPMAGGQIDLVSDVTGMSFGRPWCKDPRGIVYFFGSRGDLYAMAPGGIPECLSHGRIRRRLQALDLSSYYVRLAYDYRHDGIWIVPLPFGASASAIDSWFYDVKTGQLLGAPVFWEDRFSGKIGATTNTDRQPTALLLTDGDQPNDRRVLFGCADSRIRVADEAARSDDGLAIESFVLIGPFETKNAHSEVRITALEVTLASGLDGCLYRVYASGTPELPGLPEQQGSLAAGRNPRISVRATGAYLWLWLGSAGENKTWALENSQVRLERGGRRRIRA